MSNTAYDTPKFRKELAEFRSRWPGAMITVRDRVKFNEGMRVVNKNARRKKKRKKPVAT